MKRADVVRIVQERQLFAIKRAVDESDMSAVRFPVECAKEVADRLADRLCRAGYEARVIELEHAVYSLDVRKQVNIYGDKVRFVDMPNLPPNGSTVDFFGDRE